MVKSYGWVVVAYRILVSAPVPFGSIWVLNWVELGWDWAWGGWGLKGQLLILTDQLSVLLNMYTFKERCALTFCFPEVIPSFGHSGPLLLCLVGFVLRRKSLDHEIKL